MIELGEEQIQRYSRQILLPEIGGSGQERLLRARVLVVGAGGLGSPLLLYLAAAGVGTLGIIDGDRVELSNLQRQIAHDTPHLGALKAESAAEALRRLNPDVGLELHPCRLDADNAAALIASYDVIADGSDNFRTRFLLNDTCHAARKPLVSAALLRFEGQLSTFKGYLGAGHPCYRCLFPQSPPPGLIPSCAEAGVLGAVAGTLGTLQATEVIKELLGLGTSLSGRLVLYQALECQFRTITVPKDPTCALCGDPAPVTLSQR